MATTLNLIETTSELGIEVVEVVIASSSTPGPAGPGLPTGGTVGQVPVKQSSTDYDTAWEDQTGGGGGAPTTVDYLVGTASGDLSAEIVVGTSPGGELGGTWASPTVDATHSGSSHAAVQAAAEATAAAALSAHLTDTSDAHDASAISSVAAGNLAATDVQAALNELDTEKAAASHAHAGEDITSGTVADARIASTIARDSEVSSAIATSESGQVRDGDSAGGVLGGTYPNPSFASDMATQAELDAHINDSSAAHAASAISVDSTDLDGTGTDLQTVLEELEDQIDSAGGGSFDPVFELFGNPATAFEFDTSSLTGLTALSPTPDVENADTTVPGHYYLMDNASGNACVGRYATAPSAPFTAICRLSDSSVRQNFNLAGMFIGIATPGDMETLIISNGNQVQLLDWTSPTHSSPSNINNFTIDLGPGFYFAIRVNSSTSVDYLYSKNGLIWIALTAARNPSITIGSVGLTMAAISSSGLAAAWDYLRIWTSALAFPGIP